MSRAVLSKLPELFIVSYKNKKGPMGPFCLNEETNYFAGAIADDWRRTKTGRNT